MKQTNGFFSLQLKSEGTYLLLVPECVGGKRLQIDEITDYLNMARIFDYNRSEIIENLRNLDAPKEIKLIPETVMPEHEMVRIIVRDDFKEVVARFYPSSSDGKRLTKQEIIDTAVANKIKYGLLEEVIDEFMENPIYCTDLVIAKALLPIEGHDARVDYKFNTKMTRAPKLNEDGTVDFHQLDIINHVRTGDLIAKLLPVDYGRPGIDVCGKVIRPNTVQNVTLKHGSKVQISEDGLSLYSEVDGHVYMVEDKVCVSDLYEIDSDIDLSTGDISYNGSISIKGNVITGFTVKATGNIFVEGVVEGATLISDAGIILKRGMQGMNRGKLIAKGDVVAKFIENSTVECEGSVTTEAILHSKVFAGKEINVNGKKGFVTGGELHSGTQIHVKSAGSTMGTATILEVGTDPKVLLEYHRLSKKLNELNGEIYKVAQIVELFQKKFGSKVPADKVTTYLMAKDTYDRYMSEHDECAIRYDEMSSLISDNANGNIIIDRVIYPGCKVVISNIVYYVREELFSKQFVKNNADIKVLEHTS